jgi:hypothetical protein
MNEVRAIISEQEEKAKADRLPSHVKCMYCGGRPRYDDLLGEIVRNSSALAHQSCARKRGQMFGMNVGTIVEIDGKLKPSEE